jgi:Mn2+/Fe2+ NRAMP family transporter
VTPTTTDPVHRAPEEQPAHGTLRQEVRPLPRGRRRLGWYGPALLWTVSAVGSGSVLFTPRVASRYQYELLWLALVTCGFMWIMIREAARYTTVTGRTLLDGFDRLPGPRGWALWVIFVPQLFAAVVGIAGLSALVGSALHVSFGASPVLFTLLVIGASTAVVGVGHYDLLTKITRVMAVVLVLLSLAAAVQVISTPADVAAGLVPRMPADLDVGFVLPWVGTILAGSMGIVWFSYWTSTHGYGGPTALSAERPPDADQGDDVPAVDPEERDARLQAWMRLISRAAGLAVVAGALVIVSFNVLGAELLAPEGIVPSGVGVAADLGGLMEGVWGRFGFWALIGLTVFALGGSVMANQDGWGRSFADITMLLTRDRQRPRWATRLRLRRLYVVGVTGLLPLVLYLVVQDPVTIMSMSGVVAAVHTPFIVTLILLVNWRHLPRVVRPGLLATGLLALAGCFYLGLSLLRVVA